MNPGAEELSRLAAARCAADVLIESAGGVEPKVFVMLGSGLDGVVEKLDVVSAVDFADVPGFAASTVEGHVGRFVFGYMGDVPVLVMRGRMHLYEGHPVEALAIPVRAARLLGCDTFLVTNAAGGIHPDYVAGDIVMIEDHINLMFTNPLIGPNLDQVGERFPSMSDAYSSELRSIARGVAAESGIAIHEGVYAGVSGPVFETSAEVRMLRNLGADVVGMSTVPEVIAAVHCGMRVLGFSLVTNTAAESTHGHEDVLVTARRKAPVLAELMAGILTRL